MESFSDLLLAFASREDSIFYFVLVLSAAAFAGAELVWWARRRRAHRSQPVIAKRDLPQDDPRFQPLWTVVPALVLFLLCFVSQKTPKPLASNIKQHRIVKSVSLDRNTPDVAPRLARPSSYGR